MSLRDPQPKPGHGVGGCYGERPFVGEPANEQTGSTVKPVAGAG